MTAPRPIAPMTPTRRAMMAIGVATIGLSLVMSIAPALAKSANSGTIKVHDASNGQEAAESGNEPHVCSFWVGFYGSETSGQGTWQLLGWPPTGDKSVVLSGSYDTSGDGVDVTSTLSPAAGHYRFEWQATGDSNGKHKTLWVDSDCGADADAEATPTATASTSPSASPSETPVETVAETSAESPSASPSETPVETVAETASPTPVASVAETSAESPSASPSETPVETDAETASPTPEGDVLSGNPDPAPPSLPDTSMGLESSGLLAAIGILLLVGAHAGRRQPGRA